MISPLNFHLVRCFFDAVLLFWMKNQQMRGAQTQLDPSTHRPIDPWPILHAALAQKWFDFDNVRLKRCNVFWNPPKKNWIIPFFIPTDLEKQRYVRCGPEVCQRRVTLWFASEVRTSTASTSKEQSLGPWGTTEGHVFAFCRLGPPLESYQGTSKRGFLQKKKVEDDVSEMETIYMLNRVFLYSYVSGCNMV